MAFNEAPYFGGRYVEKHRTHAAIAVKILKQLGLQRSVGVYSIRFEVWASVIWVWVPGFRPRFVSRRSIGV